MPGYFVLGLPDFLELAVLLLLVTLLPACKGAASFCCRWLRMRLEMGNTSSDGLHEDPVSELSIATSGCENSDESSLPLAAFERTF